MTEEPLKILLVEDNPGDARVVSAMLDTRHHGEFLVRHVDRLADALSVLAEEPMDAVLLDLSLPDSSGISTVDSAKLRDPESRTPIIVVTGQYGDDQALESMQHGAQDYLLKNDLKADALVRSIRFAVERQRARLRRESAETEQRRIREIETLEQFGAPGTTTITARAYGIERLADASPDTFQFLVDQYGDLITQAIEQRKFRIKGKVSQGLRVMAQRLGFLRAGPRDVIDLHLKTIRDFRPLNMPTTYVVAEEARLMLVELMGSLTSYYRDRMVPLARPQSNVLQDADRE